MMFSWKWTWIACVMLMYQHKVMSICGDSNLNATVGRLGSLQSPNYPNNYPSNSECWWTITAPHGYRVLINFTTFDLESCCDYLRLYDAPSQAEATHLNTALDSATVSSSPILSNFSYITMKFESDGSVQRKGFRLTFIASSVPTDTVATTVSPPTTTSRQFTNMPYTTTSPIIPPGQTLAELIRATSGFAQAAYSTLIHSYNYIYDGSGSYINDGGNDMYDDGNKLGVRSTYQDFQNITYNSTFSDPDDNFVGATISGHPFLAILAVNLSNGFIEFNETSDLGADSSGFTKQFGGFVSVHPFSVEYQTFQVYGAYDPTVVQVFFVLTSYLAFGSTGYWNFTLNTQNSDTSHTRNTARLEGHMENVYFGYALLSRYDRDYGNDVETSKEEVEAFITNILYRALGQVPPPYPPRPDTTTPYPTPFYTTTNSPAGQTLVQLIREISGYAEAAYSTLIYSYNYIYDGSGSYINDGGNDMYDDGNKLGVRSTYQDFQEIVYSSTFSDPDGNFVGESVAGHPFLAILAVNLSNGFIEFNEASDLGADGSGFTKQFGGFVSVHPFSVEYQTFQVYGAYDPTVVQVFFVLTSYLAFGSTGYWNFTLNTQYSDTSHTRNTARLEGHMENVHFGYALLSRYDRNHGKDVETSKEEVDAFITNILYQALGQVPPPYPVRPDVTTPYPTSSYSTFYTPPYPTGGPTGGPPTGGCGGAYRESLRRWNEMRDEYMHTLESWKQKNSCN